MKTPPSREGKPLLVEIGCEEIPARFLDEAQKSFKEGLQAALQEARLLGPAAPAVQSYSTPRRLVVWVPSVLERQAVKVDEVLGPPVKVGLDAHGKPTKAGESFARKNSALPGDLVQVATPKGLYLALRKSTPGRPGRQILPAILPAVITSLSFSKSMYWVAKSGPRFVRPIRWVVALLGEGKQAWTVPFEIAGVRSGNSTRGHRALGKGAIRVHSFQEYRKKLWQAGVEIDPMRRREAVRSRCKALLEAYRSKALKDKGAKNERALKLGVVIDEDLETWVVNSCEWPTPILGAFDRLYRNMPREILTTVMRDHQKYFSVEDEKGVLQSVFIAVLNLDRDEKGWIRQGHERVMAARLSDALFFLNNDNRIPLAARQGLLSRITYQAELGSYADKVQRMRAIASKLCAELEALGKFGPADTERALRAIELSKCDLTTQMVKEFPELQGVVGGLYAERGGEPREVHQAIYDHYLPQGLEDRCPRTVYGAVVSLADKLDNLAGGFAVGNEPAGSSDPFALRRQANGIIKVLLELSLAINLRQAVAEALRALNLEWQKPQSEVFSDVMNFLEDRLRHYLEAVGKLRYDTVRAVLRAGWELPLDALRRAKALEKIRGGENFEALSLASKRIKNILAKSAGGRDWEPGEVDPKALQEGSEEELYLRYLAVNVEARAHGEAGEYEKAFEAIASLRPVVDRFFDQVLVMAEDRALRQNRLRLLRELDELFSWIAHFAEIAPGSAHVDASTYTAPRSDR